MSGARGVPPGAAARREEALERQRDRPPCARTRRAARARLAVALAGALTAVLALAIDALGARAAPLSAALALPARPPGATLAPARPLAAPRAAAERARTPLAAPAGDERASPAQAPLAADPRPAGARERGPRPARLALRVLAAGGPPGPGARLELRHQAAGADDESVREVALDADGRAVLELAPGRASVCALAEDATAGPLCAELAAGEERALTLVLAPARAVAGVVVDALDGRAIAGARVSFWTFAESDRAITGADGSFRHPRFPGGDFAHQVRVEAEGYGSSVRYLEFPADDRWALPAVCDGALGQSGTGRPWLRLALVPALGVQGRVVDDAGAPLAGARVVAEGYFRILPGVASRDEASATSDADGRFALAGLRSDVGHALRVVREGFAERSLELAATGEREAWVGAIALAPALALAGVVLDPDGLPAVDLAVEVEPDAPCAASAAGALDVAARLDGRRRARTDAQGLFACDGLAAGLYRVRVARDGETLAEASARAGGAGALVLRLPAGSLTLHGVVRDERGPVAGCEVALERFGPVATVRTDGEGRFRVAGLDDRAAYRLLASAPAGAEERARTARAEVWGYESARLRLGRPGER